MRVVPHVAHSSAEAHKLLPPEEFSPAKLAPLLRVPGWHRPQGVPAAGTVRYPEFHRLVHAMNLSEAGAARLRDELHRMFSDAPADVKKHIRKVIPGTHGKRVRRHKRVRQRDLVCVCHRLFHHVQAPLTPATTPPSQCSTLRQLTYVHITVDGEQYIFGVRHIISALLLILADARTSLHLEPTEQGDLYTSAGLFKELSKDAKVKHGDDVHVLAFSWWLDGALKYGDTVDTFMVGLMNSDKDTLLSTRGKQILGFVLSPFVWG